MHAHSEVHTLAHLCSCTCWRAHTRMLGSGWGLFLLERLHTQRSCSFPLVLSHAWGTAVFSCTHTRTHSEELLIFPPLCFHTLTHTWGTAVFPVCTLTHIHSGAAHFPTLHTHTQGGDSLSRCTHAHRGAAVFFSLCTITHTLRGAAHFPPCTCMCVHTYRSSLFFPLHTHTYMVSQRSCFLFTCARAHT